MNKTILFLSPTGTLTNGAEIAGLHLMKFLVKKGYNVINIPCGFGDKIYQEKMREAGVKIEPLLFNWWNGDLTADDSMRNIQVISTINKLIKKYKPAFFITNTADMPWGAISASMADIPHMWLVHEDPDGEEFGWLTDKFDFIGKYSNNVLAVNAELVKTIQRRIENYNASVSGFYPYTDISAIKLADSGDSIRLVSPNFITPRKNQLELIRALTKLHEQDIKLELIMIGGEDDQYGKIVREEVKKNNLDKFVKFINYTPDPWQYISKNDIFVFTSSNETFGLSFVEALKLGIPSVVSDNIGFSQVHEITQLGNIYNLGDVGDLVDKIKLVYDNIDDERQKAKNGIMVANDKLSLENCYKNIFEILEKSEAKNPMRENRHIEKYITSGGLNIKLDDKKYRLEANVARLKRVLKNPKIIINKIKKL